MARFTKFQGKQTAIPAIPASQRTQRVIEVALLPGVSYEEALGWLGDVDIELIEKGVYGPKEIRTFLVYENEVRTSKLFPRSG